MSAERTRRLEAMKEAARNNIVSLVIRLSSEGKITWDFSSFDNDLAGRTAMAEFKGTEFRSTHVQDEGVQLKISSPDTFDLFGGTVAIRLRHFLEQLGSDDPALTATRRESKARSKRILQERRRREKENLHQLNEVFQLLQSNDQ